MSNGVPCVRFLTVLRFPVLLVDVNLADVSKQHHSSHDVWY